LISACAWSAAAMAQSAQTIVSPAEVNTGFQAGDFMIRLRGIGVIPENLSSSVSLIGGKVDVTATPAPEIDFSYFITDHIAAELIAASTRHDVSASGTALGHVDVGSVWVLPPTLTLQYHFLPQGFINPYVGAGVTAAFFYDSKPAGGAVTKFGLSNTVGPALQIGLDISLGGRWYANIDAKQIFLNTEARLDGGVIRAKTSLSPTVVGAGIGYRF
jgi:outer membrane protein